MAEIKKLLARRKVSRSRVTMSFNKISTYGTLTPTERAVEKCNLLEYKDNLVSVDKTIQDLKFTDSDKIDEGELDREMEACSEYQCRIRECITILDSYSDVDRSNGQLLENARTLLKQPVAPLPVFAGEGEDDLMAFLKEFELTTAPYKYPDRDLLLLLRQQLSGKAKTLLKSLEADKQTYKDAKDLLTCAFASPENRKFSAINKLTHLKLDYGDDPFEFISKVKMLQESVHHLGVESDDFLQYFVWNGLNDKFKSHLVQVTTKSKPSINEIIAKFFEANERYEQSQKQYKCRNDAKKEKSRASFAVNVRDHVHNKSKGCSLCSKVDSKPSDHPIFRCNKFENPRMKLEQIERFNGCTKCASWDHVTSRCNFKFNRKCDICFKWHFRFLCPQWSTGSQKQKTENKVYAKPSEASSGVAILQNATCDCILPTFSFNVNGSKFRALKDSGSQSSFITRKFAESQNLKVLRREVKLTVEGFNKPQTYLTRLVEVCIKLGDKHHKIPAVVVPEIKVNLDLPKLSQIVSKFKEKGYVMADSLLGDSDVIRNIDFLLGADAAYCLPTSDKCFGNSSMYVNTHIGVLLSGQIDNYIVDLSCLPRNNLLTDKFSLVVDSSGKLDPRCAEENTIDVFKTHSFFISSYFEPLNLDDCDHLDYKVIKTSSNVSILDDKGRIVDSLLRKATNEILEAECSKYINYDNEFYNDESIEAHDKLINFTLSNISKENDGRLSVPLLWNGKVSNCLAKNRHLSELILKSNRKRLKHEQLELMDQTIKDQTEVGIIEKIHNLDHYLAEHPEYSFLPHMGVFKPDRETTKCRVVFLSNLCEKSRAKLSLSHNQAMFAGPNLNQKLSSAFLQLRFGSHLLLYDLKKAFNQLQLSETDQSKLLFFWFNNVEKGDFSPVVYKNIRLSFGLRCSPFLLMISLYYILVLDSGCDSRKVKDLKHLMYGLLYMDNGAITSDSSEHLKWAYDQLQSIYSPYKFSVQQLSTNDPQLQVAIDNESGESTPDVVKLFGLHWNRMTDTVCTKQISLDGNATTKRLILKSIASQFDIFNFNMPILNRSRLFMHSLQCNKSLGWDVKLSPSKQKEWNNICKQANATPLIHIPRFVGPREGTYKLYAFTDASHVFYGCVIYILHIETGKVSFLSAKNRLVSTQLKCKSIPSLELNAITLGVENLMETYKDLAGPQCIKPINISELSLYTDSLCCLHWLHLDVDKFDKLQKRSAFVINRLQSIKRMCNLVPVTFQFISGKENPSDCVTRCLSYKLLQKSNYFTGPDLSQLHKSFDLNDMKVTIPNPLIANSKATMNIASASLKSDSRLEQCTSKMPESSLLNPANFSSFRKLIRLYRRVLFAFQKWKSKAGLPVMTNANLLSEAARKILASDQRKCFADVFEYFEKDSPRLVDIPKVLSQMNIFIDHDGLLRVKSKFKKWHNTPSNFPILLDSDSHLTGIIIFDAHEKVGHSGVYSVLTELRSSFFIPKHFSTVKKFLKNCIVCKRFNARTVKINQSQYRDFRTEPPQIPFANIFIDHLGPFNVKKNTKTEKVWLLIITCTWSRAINLKICHDLSLKEFLRAFQMHVFEFGVPQLCMSDLGSQLSAGFNVITDFLRDSEVQLYFESMNVKPLSFQQYFKGCNELGSLVEVCVKIVKRLIFGCIKNNVLDYYDFEFLMFHVVHLANRRPVAFKEALRESNFNSIPEPITPELLIRGYELTSLNLIPDLQEVPLDPDWVSNAKPSSSIQDQYAKLRKVRSDMIDRYQSEFLGNLIAQAVDRKDRYQPVTHTLIKKGDIVLLKEVHVKPNHYPMGLVKETFLNENGELTGALVLKGKTKEIVKRHSSTLIPLLRDANVDGESQVSQTKEVVKRSQPHRKAADVGKERTRAMLE